WMSCRTGIFRVRKADFNALDRGQIKALPCISFGRNDGLPTVQCNGVAKPSGWKSRDGRLWFPTIRSVVAVESRVKTNDRPPPVAIEEVIVDRKSLQRSLDTPKFARGTTLAAGIGGRTAGSTLEI